MKKISGKLRPGKVRKPQNFQTAKAPKQQNTEKLSDRLGGQPRPIGQVWSFLKGVKEAWFWASFPLVLISTIYNIEPHIQISASTNQDDTSSFGTLIAVTNSGHVSISNVRMDCLVNAGEPSAPDGLIFRNVNISKFLSGHMRAGSTLTSGCGIAAPNVREHAQIKVSVNYRWAWGVLPGSETTLLSSEVDVHGRAYMIPTEQ